ncbi:MAG: hypothetical protein RLZ98_514 [Pseudomonadota bacterium]
MAMSYKGEDLDLRTPERWSTGREGASEAGLWSRSTIYNGGRSDPLLVDETALSAINHAYDLAVAHRASEVHLEHLLNAMTLNQPAARIMEDHGISVPALRRESASIVATVIPAGLNGNNVPRTSEAIEDLLRHAADRAYPRRTPINIDTLLEVMSDMKQDLSGLDLLRRHANARKSNRLATATEAMRETPAASSTVTDTVQNSRLDALEQLVKNLSAELAAERQAYAALAGDAQRPALAQLPARRNTLAPRSELDDEAIRLIAQRLDDIDAGIEERFSDLARGWVDLGDRLREFETKFEQRADFGGASIDTAALEERLQAIATATRNFPQTDHLAVKLSAIERTFNAMLDRLGTLEDRLETALQAGGTQDLVPMTSMIADLETHTSAAASGTKAVYERMAAIERKLDAVASRPAVDTSAVASTFNEQANRIETAIGEQLTPLRQVMSSFEQRAQQLTTSHDETIDELHDALLKLNSNQQTLSTSIDRWRLDQTGDIGLIANRVQNVEAETNGLKSLVETMASNIGVVYTILARREENRSKFKNWLFGTDDWYSASWDTERWRQQMIEAGSFVPMPRRRAK